jgi:hypothetical protein
MCLQTHFTCIKYSNIKPVFKQLFDLKNSSVGISQQVHVYSKRSRSTNAFKLKGPEIQTLILFMLVFKLTKDS